MKKNKLYLILLLACAAGILYTAISYQYITEPASSGICLIKHVTDIPCPACGSTRSVLSILQGDLNAAIFWNPLGLILFFIMLIAPAWILYDTLSRRSSFFIFYNRMEIFLRKKWISISAVLLIAGNWIWNIYKDL